MFRGHVDIATPCMQTGVVCILCVMCNNYFYKDLIYQIVVVGILLTVIQVTHRSIMFSAVSDFPANYFLV